MACAQHPNIITTHKKSLNSSRFSDIYFVHGLYFCYPPNAMCKCHEAAKRTHINVNTQRLTVTRRKVAGMEVVVGVALLF